MKQPRIIVIVVLLLWTSSFSVQTQSVTASGAEKIPRVFQIGEYESEYVELIKTYPQNLLSICNDSMEMAYEKWMYLLLEMEEYGKEINFDLKGLKIWMNVFWNEDGTIDYLTYYPKPSCKNIPFEELTAFFKLFVKQYTPQLTADENYSHYGSAIFPSFAKMFLPEKSNAQK